ncbi:DUF397 domain-containing protein [Kibdelosporangium persicum]|uniref:DUF397 domain-containing protein n=1 Tax=Kibdelosporangium persicum TaxID=2698649 RepID=UPI001563B42F|nr:DUF397 domain-containing protein [Kibdelosporangium persicum]
MRYEDAITALAAATNWHKATFSQGGENGCVEVGSVPGIVGVRDTKLGAASPILAFTPEKWEIFAAGLRSDDVRL